MKKICILMFVIAIAFLQCQSDGKTEARSGNFVNPNGDSELALLMREMFDQHLEAKNALLRRDTDVSLKDFSDLHSAEATEPDKVASDVYKSMANAYLTSVEVYEEAAFIKKHEMFNGVVDNCMSCHQVLCPGPMVKIKKLYLKDSDLEKFN